MVTGFLSALDRLDWPQLDEILTRPLWRDSLILDASASEFFHGRLFFWCEARETRTDQSPVFHVPFSTPFILSSVPPTLFNQSGSLHAVYDGVFALELNLLSLPWRPS